MKTKISLLAVLTLAVLALAAAPTAASAATLFQSDDVTVNMHAYAQGVAVAQDVPDNVRNKDRLYLFVKEARLRWDGLLYGATYDIMLAPGAEDITPKWPSSNMTTGSWKARPKAIMHWITKARYSLILGIKLMGSPPGLAGISKLRKNCHASGKICAFCFSDFFRK